MVNFIVQKVIKHLSKDPVMKRLIKENGVLEERDITKDLFVDILESIVSQQLSVKAADTIWSRFIQLFPKKKITPKVLLTIPDEKIREAGISRSKIAFMKGIAQEVLNKTLHIDGLLVLSDEEVIEELVKLKGIGRWTAEMILMSSLAREDIFSIGDAGLRTAMTRLYNVESTDYEKMEEIALQWKPFRSYASRYLWKSLNNTPKISNTEI